MPDHEQIRQENSKIITATVKQLSDINYDTVAQLIPRLLAKGLLQLDSSAYVPADVTLVISAGIGRYLIYDHDDPQNPFSIWAFALAPRQKTSIHDHQYKGTVTVLEGPVSEKYYQPSSEGYARLIGRADRYRFHSNSDNLEDDFVHQLKRRKGLGEGISVTLHIYNMAAYLINQQGTAIDNRNLDTIYTKDKNQDEQDALPYDGEYSQLRP